MSDQQTPTHTDSGNSGGSKTSPGAGFPDAKPGQVGGARTEK